MHAGDSSRPIVLSMHDIHKRFGGTQALAGVALEARAGECLALIGENGAGKSTLMKVLSGVCQPDAGRMSLSGNTYAPSGPHAARLAGIAMIYQELNLAGDLSVEDNVMLGLERGRFGLLDRKAQRHAVREALRRLGHENLPLSLPVRSLSVGLRQVVEIARALVLDAKAIVFDEPTSSLSRHDTERLFAVIERLKESGIAIIYISHFLEEIRRVAERYVVLRDGRLAGTGSLQASTEADIVRLMVGRDVADLFPSVPHQPAEVLLRVTSLAGQKLPRDVSFTVRRGEIFGVAGLVGSGRTETLRCLMGLDRVRNGSVFIADKPIPMSVAARMRAGLALVSEDRKGEGLALERSIVDNATYGRLDKYSRAGWINLRRRRGAVLDWMSRLQVKARAPEQAIGELSGGNQQKVALLRVMHQNAEVYLLDEPTRGVDVGAKAEIYRLIGELAASGKAVVFVSSYLPELLAMCDTIGVVSRGRMREVRPAKDWTQESVMSVAVALDEVE